MGHDMYNKLLSVFFVVVSFGSANNLALADDAQLPANCPAPAAPTETTEPTLASQGMWKDPNTQLIWSRCALGQEWAGDVCTGEPVKLSWKDAKDEVSKVKYAGKDGWRLPTLYELKALKLREMSNPAKACNAPWFFKSTEGYGWNWSSTPYSYFGGSLAWGVDLDSDKWDSLDKSRELRTFLVRRD